MRESYFAILVLFGFGIVLASAFIVISSLLGRKKKSSEKIIPYECGIDPVSEPRRRMSVTFFLTAVVFLLFDVEVTFLIPWALIFQSFKSAGFGLFILGEGLIFIGVLGVALAYVWKKGALRWEHY